MWGGLPFQLSWGCPCHPVELASHPCPAEPQRLARSRRQRKMQPCRPRRPACQTPLAAQRAQRRRRRRSRRQKRKPPKPVRALCAGGLSSAPCTFREQAVVYWIVPGESPPPASPSVSPQRTGPFSGKVGRVPHTYFSLDLSPSSGPDIVSQVLGIQW